MKNLNGWSVSQNLPIGDFCELKITRISLKTSLGTPKIDEHGFLMEYD